MQLPWVQLTNEVIEAAAPMVAVELGEDELRILGALVKAYRWALLRCPDHRPPSDSAVVEGPLAAKLILLKSGLTGVEPEAFVDACERAGLMQRVPDGIRIKGLDRYDAAWGKNHPELWAAVKRARALALVLNAKDSESVRNRAGSEPESSPQTQTQTKKQIQKEEKQLLAAAPTELPLDDEQLTPDLLQRLWNGYPTLPRWRELTKNRRKQAASRIRERPDVREWRLIIAKVAASSFCTGAGKNNWRADPDWLLKPDTAAKVLEGKYDDPGARDQLPLSAEPAVENKLPDTPAGNAWGEIWAVLNDEGKLYALQWLQQLHPLALDGGELELGCPDGCFLDWLRDHYLALIQEKATHIGGWTVRLTDMKARAA